EDRDAGLEIRAELAREVHDVGRLDLLSRALELRPGLTLLDVEHVEALPDELVAGGHSARGLEHAVEPVAGHVDRHIAEARHARPLRRRRSGGGSRRRWSRPARRAGWLPR